MAHKVSYKYQGEEKEFLFTYSEFHNMHEAVADAEGIDLTQFLAMEQQVISITKGKAAGRNFRDAEFLKMGFTDLYFWKNGGEE
ncbi:MAG: DUF2960 domain-containing protein [Pseudomonadales bacterium]|nr:DUF2960 domain-containing protein [Pseudomonadales bacterium]